MNTTRENHDCRKLREASVVPWAQSQKQTKPTKNTHPNQKRNPVGEKKPGEASTRQSTEMEIVARNI